MIKPTADAATSSIPEATLALDAFVRSIGVDKSRIHAFFLGAGASITSGMPSAEICIWEWKRAIFLTQNPGLEDQFKELSLPVVREKLQRWFDSQGGYPKLRAPEEYGFYIERCYPIAEHRRLFFQQKIQKLRPHIGYQQLCCLAEAGVVDSTWSTNFDALTSRAAAAFDLTTIEVGIDSQVRVMRPPRAKELLCVSLHGDYRYDALKNTPDELRAQESALLDALADHVRERSLIVSGYSGRDGSIMAALAEAFARRGNGALYWCGLDGGSVPGAVQSLIESVRKSGRTAFYVPTAGFDDLVTRLARHCLEGSLAQRATAIVASVPDAAQLGRAAFSVPDLPPGKIIKSNAFEIQCPPEVLTFELTAWPEDHVWRSIEERTTGHEVVAVPFRGRVLAIGTIAGVQQAFAGAIKGPVERTPLSADELRFEGGAVVSLLKRALVRSLAETNRLASDGRDMIWDTTASEVRKHQGTAYHVHEAALIFLRRIGATNFLIVKPSLRILSERGEEVPEDVERALKVSILGWQHNAQFNKAMDRWRKRLFAGTSGAFEFPTSCGSTFRFEIRKLPSFAQIAVASDRPPITVKASTKALVRHYGFQLEEPALIFADRRTGAAIRDTHPVRGIANNRPFDYSLTERKLAPSVRLGIVCPSADRGGFARGVERLNQKIEPSRSERDYLPDFPGFERAFGVPIEVPSSGTAGWSTYPEPDPTLDSERGALALAGTIIRAIDGLHASYGPSVVVVFVPTRFEKWTKFETANEKFDLHDFVKAYCVQRGIATQFLRQDTFEDPLQCRVWWWMSLALYAKSMRTPWVLDVLDGDTAFVGLGFSIDRKAKAVQHVVLGCSHIYNARGEGLQYRLTKVESPLIRGKNAFMSVEDARRVGETIRQLFFESKLKLPSRVVIHKRTPFLRDERDGLRQGLEGISAIDMLELNIDDALRYVSSIARPDGSFDEDNYPVDRGSVVQIAPHEALLWVHGVTSALNPKLHYYQGKRRIPAPLILRRHAGNSDLRLLANEIMGLSKMDWNNFDLYTKLPATVESSNRIARIGSLLDRFGANPYDYRLFI
jgi:hypothetical protein